FRLLGPDFSTGPLSARPGLCAPSGTLPQGGHDSWLSGRSDYHFRCLREGLDMSPETRAVCQWSLSTGRHFSTASLMSPSLLIPRATFCDDDPLWQASVSQRDGVSPVLAWLDLVSLAASADCEKTVGG